MARSFSHQCPLAQVEQLVANSLRARREDDGEGHCQEEEEEADKENSIEEYKNAEA